MANSAGAFVISLDFNVNLWHQSFSSLENLAEQEKLWCQFFREGLVCQNRLLIEPSQSPIIARQLRGSVGIHHFIRVNILSSTLSAIQICSADLHTLGKCFMGFM